MSYAAWLRQRRLEAGLSIEKLEELSGLGLGTISRIEQGTRRPMVTTRGVILAALLKHGVQAPQQRRLRILAREVVDFSEHPDMPQLPEFTDLVSRMRYELEGVDPDGVPTAAEPPGQVLYEVLALRGWSQVRLATIMDISAQYVSSLVRGIDGFTPRVALELEAALGEPSAEFWLCTQRNWDLITTRVALSPQLAAIRSRSKGPSQWA